MTTVKRFHRYGTVEGHCCKRMGRFDVTWEKGAFGETLCHIKPEIPTLPLSRNYTYYHSRAQDMLSRTKRYLDYRIPPHSIIQSILDGDTDACQGCTYCQKFIFKAEDDAVSYTAYYDSTHDTLTGTLSLSCANPGVYLQDSIEWVGTFTISHAKSRDYWPTLALGTDIPHPHTFSSGNVCLNNHSRRLAKTLFDAGEWSSAIRVILEAARTITPEDVADQHALENYLGIAMCRTCNSRFAKHDLYTCDKCAASVCDDCRRDYYGQTLCTACHALQTFTDTSRDDYAWTQDGIPQEPCRDHDPIQRGSLVILGKHDPNDGSKYWTSAMNKYVGAFAIVTNLCGTCPYGYPIVKVNVDRGRHCWRIKHMQLGIPKGD